MLTLMGIHIDVVDGRADEAIERVADGLVLTGQREHGAVVAGVAGAIEQEDAGHARDRVGQSIDDVETPPLGDVRDRFDEHDLMLAGRRRARVGVRLLTNSC